MNRKRVWLVLGLMICFAASVALAQQQVPPPPKPPDDGPSLADTLQFIQEKLNGLGTVNYAVSAHDNKQGNDFTNVFQVTLSNVSALPANGGSPVPVGCPIFFHQHTVRDGEAVNDGNFVLPIKQVTNIDVVPVSDSTNQDNARNGHPELVVTSVNPPNMVVLRVFFEKQAGPGQFYFLEPSLADRVAKAIQHAAELCGAGNKKEPF